MNIKHLILTAALALQAISAPAEASPSSRVVDHLQNISVTIYSESGSGSGTIINRGGVNYVLTAAHVVQGNRSAAEAKKVAFRPVRVYWNIQDGGRLVGSTTIDADILNCSGSKEGEDLALLKLRKSNPKAETGEFIKEEAPALGAPLIHVGSFMGDPGSNSLTTGVYSYEGRMYQNVCYDQVSCTAYPGSSGGLVANSQGEIVGVLVRGYGENCHLIVPTRRIRAWAKECGAEFILDATKSADESKIVLETPEGPEGDEEEADTRFPERSFHFMLFRKPAQATHFLNLGIYGGMNGTTYAH